MPKARPRTGMGMLTIGGPWAWRGQARRLTPETVPLDL